MSSPSYHSCLLCNDHLLTNKLFSSLAFKKHLLSKKHLAICRMLVELKTQKRLQLIEIGDELSESADNDYTTIEELSADEKTKKIFVICNKYLHGKTATFKTARTVVDYRNKKHQLFNVLDQYKASKLKEIREQLSESESSEDENEE